MIDIPAPPPSLLPWLVYEQSLTNKLHELAGDAHLAVLDQRKEQADAWDQNALKLKAGPVVHRQILIEAHGIPCWYARTVIPEGTWQSDTALFDRLKTESLGQLIFNGHKIKRETLTHYMITPSSPEYQWLNQTMHQDSSSLWVRLSEFRLTNGNPFFLLEILLPGLLHFAK